MDVNGFRTLEELFAAGLAPTELSAADTVEVMDGLQACESSWHGGFSLADTVLSCLYVHCPERLEGMRSPVLRAFCNGVRASIGLVRAMVLQADIYEEEDFAPHPFGARGSAPSVMGSSRQPPLFASARCAAAPRSAQC